MINESEVVTRSFLAESLQGLEDRLVGKMDGLIEGNVASMMDGKLADIEKRIDGKLDGMEKRITEKTEALITEKVDHLARLVNKGFMDIEARMATKVELRELEGRLMQWLDGFESHLSASFSYMDEKWEVHDAQLKALEKRP